MNERNAEENAWKIHAAIVDWTGKVDSKASFVLAAESALSLAILGLAGGGRRLSKFESIGMRITFWSGATLLVIALLLVLAVVRPRLRRKATAVNYTDNYIYFGHLIHWQEDDLLKALRGRAILPVLSRQVIAMSRIAWKKHRYLQVSISAASLAAACFTVAAISNGQLT